MELLQCKYDCRQPAGHFHRATEGLFICSKMFADSPGMSSTEFPLSRGDRNGVKGSRRWALGTTQLLGVCQEGAEGTMGIAAVSWDLLHPNRILGASLAPRVGFDQEPWEYLNLVFCCCVMQTGVRKAGV